MSCSPVAVGETRLASGMGPPRPSTTATSAGRQRRLAQGVRDPGGGGWPADRGPDGQHSPQGSPLSGRRERGAREQAIGSSRGGRNTKLHALADRRGRPLAFLLTPGQAADCRAAEALLTGLPERCIVVADRAYDTDPVRQIIEGASRAL